MKKKKFLRFTSLILSAVFLLQMTVFAVPAESAAATDDLTQEPAVVTEPALQENPQVSDPAPAAGENIDAPAAQTQTKPVSDPTEAEKELPDEKAGLEIPDGWAHDALDFAVQNEILNGVNGQLLPTSSATRAQMATMLLRLVGAADVNHNLNIAGASLSAFTDVSQSAWYASYVSGAVKLGMMNGVSSTSMAPNRNITREQAFTIIGRVFGMCDGTKADLASFSDAASVSNYAVKYVAAMVKAGYLNGNNKNQLQPGANISRQELAQVLYNMFGAPGAICTSADKLPASGNVLYRSADPIADGTTINGDLILTCDCAAALTLNNVTVTGRLVVIGKDDSTVTLTGCPISRIAVISKTALSNDSKVSTAYLTGADGMSFTGDADTVLLNNDATIQGKYGTVTVTGGTATATATTTIDALTLSAKGLTFHLNGTAKEVVLNEKNTKLDGSGTAQHVLVHGKGSSINCHTGSVTQDIDNGLTGTKMTLTSGAAVSPGYPTATITATFTGVNGGYGTSNGARSCTLSWYVDGTLKKVVPGFSLKEGSTASLSSTYSFSRYSPKSSSIKAVLTYDDEELNGTTSVELKNYPDSYYAISAISTANGYVVAGDYTKFEKESFVNAKGYSSSTGWLVWINLYHTKVNVFTGSRGNWTLVQAFDCGIGAIATPTPVGIYKIQTQEQYSRWVYSSAYVDTISRWNGGYAFHSRMKWVSNGAYCGNDVNVMVSHGCIRMNTENARYIRDTVRLSSTVVVY